MKNKKNSLAINISKRNLILLNIALYISFIFMVSGNILVQELGDLDEIWIYNFARCIIDGLLPYKGFSIIITPLFPMICAIFLKIFGNGMFTLRIAEILEISAALFVIYKILRRLDIEKSISLLLILRIILYL